MKRHTLVERQHPLFSPIALISTLLLVGTMAIIVILTGGRAFSPGELSAINNGGGLVEGYRTHAEFSGDCGQCHAPFQGVAATRCESCHQGVGLERESQTGLHGRLPLADDCAECHLDHRGEDMNLLTKAVADFDHEITRFSLAKHLNDYQGFSLNCGGCHISDVDYDVSQAACVDCHETAEPAFMTRHLDAYGDDCISCHDGQDTMAQFSLDNHAQVFALTGAHQETACENCHTKGQFEGTPQACIACHEEPVAHQGLFDTECATCHTPEAWTPATIEGAPFEHETSAGFSLIRHVTNYNDTLFTCQTCHASANGIDFTKSQCADCHGTADPAFMTDHTALYGPDCLACHDGTGEMTRFDHSQVWPLEGQHTLIECDACHINKVFRDTARECNACHEEPTIHAGLFGLDCANCHSANAWQPAQLVRHEFPLNHGGQGEIECATCHTATYTQYTCYNCHEHEQGDVEQEHLDEGLTLTEIINCVECHPTGHEDEAEGD